VPVRDCGFKRRHFDPGNGSISMPHTRITVICENRAHMAKDIMGEHGFAALIKTPTTSLLMDTGQGLLLKKRCYQKKTPSVIWKRQCLKLKL
jgi:hypothetical protein